jgi:hypothetical protein
MYKRIFPGGGLHPQPLALAPLDSKSAANVRFFSDLQVFLLKKHAFREKNEPFKTFFKCLFTLTIPKCKKNNTFALAYCY